MTIEFGELLKSYRTALGVSQSRLAKRTGFVPSYISRIEAGKTEPNPEASVKFMDSLGIRVAHRNRFLLYAAGYPTDLINSVLNEEVSVAQIKKVNEEASSKPFTIKAHQTPDGIIAVLPKNTQFIFTD